MMIPFTAVCTLYHALGLVDWLSADTVQSGISLAIFAEIRFPMSSLFRRDACSGFDIELSLALTTTQHYWCWLLCRLCSSLLLWLQSNGSWNIHRRWLERLTLVTSVARATTFSCHEAHASEMKPVLARDALNHSHTCCTISQRLPTNAI